MCKGYASQKGNDNDFVEIVPIDDYDNLVDNPQYITFELWENLQDLRIETIHLMSIGFIEKIIGDSLQQEILQNAQSYRKLWKEELWESTDIEEFGRNEYFGGKAEGFEESLGIIQKYLIKNHI